MKEVLNIAKQVLKYGALVLVIMEIVRVAVEKFETWLAENETTAPEHKRQETPKTEQPDEIFYQE